MNKKLIVLVGLLIISEMRPLCESDKQTLIKADEALTNNVPETNRKDWLMTTIKAMQSAFTTCLNMYQIPAAIFERVINIDPKNTAFAQEFKIATINCSIYCALLESHPAVNLFCSPLKQSSCMYPGILPLSQSYHTKSYFHVLIKRIVRLLPYAHNFPSQKPTVKSSAVQLVESCPDTCNTIKKSLELRPVSTIIGQCQLIEQALNSCLDFYNCAPDGCHIQSVLMTKTSLTSQEINTALTNFEIRSAILEAHPALNLFCPTAAACTTCGTSCTPGLINTLDAQKRIDAIIKRLLNIWSAAHVLFPSTCQQEKPEISEPEFEKKTEEIESGDGDDSEEKNESEEKRESDLPPIFK